MIVLISRAYVTRRAGIARGLAAVAASTLLAGCGLGGGGGSTTPASGSSAPAAPAASSAGAALEEQAGSGSGGGSAVASGTVSSGATGKITGGSTGSFTHSSKTTFSVSRSQVSHSSQTTQYMTPEQAKKLVSRASKTTKPNSTSDKNSAPPASGGSPPAQNQPTAPKTQVLVVTRYKVKVYTVYRNRTITKTVTKTVPPKVPAGAFLPSRHPQLGQRAFTITGTNIGCQVGPTGVRCGIKNRDWTAPVQPRSCKTTWGFTIALAKRGLPEFACGGRSPINPAAKVIPAGWDDKVGDYICEVRSFGVNCFNSKSRSGFLFGRTGYTLY